MNDRPIDLDTVFQVKLDDKQQGYLWANLSPKSKKLITQWADQRAIQIIGEDEKGEIVQVGCPDLNPGCLVLHSEFKMTHEVKARNQLRAELRQAFKGEK